MDPIFLVLIFILLETIGLVPDQILWQACNKMAPGRFLTQLYSN